MAEYNGICPMYYLHSGLLYVARLASLVSDFAKRVPFQSVDIFGRLHFSRLCK